MVSFLVYLVQGNKTNTKPKRKINTKPKPDKMLELELKQNTFIFSSFLYLGSCLFCLIHTRYRLLTKIEEILFVFILIQTLLSVGYWVNPFPPFSPIHIVDGIFAKINVLAFSVYVLFIKPLSLFQRLSFLGLLFLAGFLFYQSDQYSRQTWCCREHTIWHAFFHMVSSYGTTYAFL